MNKYVKAFLISFVCFAALFGVAIYGITTRAPKAQVVNPVNTEKENKEKIEKDIKKVDNRTPFQKVIDDSGRINILVFGTDGARADTIMMASYDFKRQLMDVMSIPRDTYHYVKGHERKDQKKINAVYGLGKKDGGSLGMKQEISNLLGVPIHYYAKVSYSGVADIVDLIGGVRVHVPFDMDYDDEWSDPKLHIHIQKGTKVLNGKNSVKYLRWRQNNDGSHQDGDIGRIQRQQKFVISAIKKAIGPKLPVVIKTAFNYVSTDMGLNDMIYYANKLVEFDVQNIKTYRLPGEWKGYYYVHDPAEAEDILKNIYARGNPEAQKALNQKEETNGEEKSVKEEKKSKNQANSSN